MAVDKAERRKLRKAELEGLTDLQLKDIKPYKKDMVAPTKTEPHDQKEISKSEMIETILAHEGLGQSSNA